MTKYASGQIVVSNIRVRRTGRWLMRWKCEARLNGGYVYGWGLTQQAAIRDALNYRIAEHVLADFKSKKRGSYVYGQ